MTGRPPAAFANRARRLADGLTVARALLGLPLILALSGGQAALAWWLLVLGGLSDALDGWLARRAGGGSEWGARLDPLTDKILIAAPLLWLGAQPAWPQQLPLWAVWLLLARELLISGWRAGASGGGPASLAGKGKTVLQFASLLLLLWPPGWQPGPEAVGHGLPMALHQLGWWLFWPSLLLALSSARGYLFSR
ncbi:MAG: CDP-alcohol phosphatidyltransferase family protein [Cyanobium sp. Prado107]|nr:CDP-alcohol phosphatidyltransferase family protein [Cyanobium sp. Prado107]